MKLIQTDTIADVVADTLFIPLYMRCRESRRGNGIIHDPDACRIVEAVDYDFSNYDKACRSQVGTCIRVRYFDNITRSFIRKHENPVIVCLGCGLDNRFGRVGGDKGVFYNLDLPEVMEVREQLLPAGERNISLHESMFGESWAEALREKHPDSDFLVLAEGVFLYFTEEAIRPVIERIAQTLAPGELLFDACTSLGCKMSSKHDTVKYTNASFNWPLNDDRLPEEWAPNLRLRETSYYMDKELDRWDRLSRFMRLIPPLAKAFKMLHYQMNLRN